MAVTQIKDTKQADTTNDDAVDFAVGSQKQAWNYTFSTFYRSVLFQMVLFGA
jgi:hypothetical protein